MSQHHVDLPALATASRHTLLTLWKDIVGHPPPRALSREFLMAMVAWHWQAKTFGGLTRVAQQALRRGHSRKGDPACSGMRLASALPVGTVLLKTYRGQRYTVTVEREGLAFQGRVYPSLSEIARAITGTRWNGPAFFGLRRPPVKANKKAPKT